ncbi:exodeoxyribonuclease V subunit alpha [Buchnera aphidicola]|uniref:exodeoxyribonuclease V subunit alpha n=1 Tax=Buchnera aphidicola TaxID=9 RepID=UPI003463EDFD
MWKLIKKILKKKIKKIDYYFAKEIITKKNDTFILIISIYISFMYRKGNTCVSLKNILKNKFFPKKIFNKLNLKKNIKKELLKNKNFSEKNKNVPLIIENNFLHLNKIWHIENTIYKFFNYPYKEKKYSNIFLKKIFNDKIFINMHLEQKIVIILCFLKKFLFIIGDPGTGKTTLVSKIIYFYIFFLKKKKIILCAPTGKASAKLLESVQSNLKLFMNKKYKKYIPQTTFTIHRLFKIYKKNNFFSNKNKKNIDLLIIDESSMIDIFMLEKIIKYISKKTKIIFLGDKNQLPSINSGSIIHDILFFYKKEKKKKLYYNLLNLLTKKSLKEKNLLLKNNVFILKKKYRFKEKSNIDKCAEIIKNGKIENIKKIVINKFKQVKFFSIKKNSSYEKIIKKLFIFFKKFFQMIKKNKPIKNILKYFNKKRILCLIKNDFFGVKGINYIFKKLIKKKYPQFFFKNNKKKWYIGKPIIISKNINNMNLFNGLVGITLLDKKKEKKIFFLMPDKTIKIVPINLIKKYQTTWAITVHKSQGSEFSEIHLILPLHKMKIMTREIIYTAITRAKKKIYIYSKKKIFIQAIQKKKIRISGLYQKFKNTNNYKKN